MERYVTNTLRSILGQTHEDLEVLVMDDGSTDGSLELVRGFQDPRIKIHPHPVNTGVVHALNRGLRASSGRYIALIAADDLWTPDSLEKRLEAFRASDMLVCGQVLDIKDSCSLENALKKGSPSKQRFFYGPSNLLRREVFERWGMFDPALSHGSDRELWVRLFGRDRLRTDRGTFTCLPTLVGYFRQRLDSLGHSYKDLSPASRADLYDLLQKTIDRRQGSYADLELLEPYHG